MTIFFQNGFEKIKTHIEASRVAPKHTVNMWADQPKCIAAQSRSANAVYENAKLNTKLNLAIRAIVWIANPGMNKTLRYAVKKTKEFIVKLAAAAP